MRLKLVLVGLAVLVGAACGAAGDDGAPPRLEIGSSAEGFQELADGGDLLLYHGPQGGYHVYLGVRVSGVAPGASGSLPRPCEASSPNPCVDFVVEDLDGARVVDAYVGLRVALTASAEEAGSYDLVPPRLVPVAIAGFEELEGKRVRVSAVVVDRHGVRVEKVVDTRCVAVR